MVKKFTVDDIEEITLAAYMIGVEAIWCKIIFKGCVNATDFYTSPHANNEFAQELYEKLLAEEFGELQHGLGDFRTQPPEQDEVEAKVISTRNQLLLESDFTEFPSTQSRFTEETIAAWAEYRQALRDLPTQIQFPWDPIWPVKP